VDSKKLEELGFTVEAPWDERTRKAVVKVKKTAVGMETFASTRDGDDRINTQAVGAAMVQMLQIVMGNERLLNVIGDQQAVELLKLINKYIGLPRDFSLRSANPSIPPKEQLVALLQQFQQQILGQVGEGIKPVTDTVVQMEQGLQQVAQQTQVNSAQIAEQAELVAKLSSLFQASMQANAEVADQYASQLQAPPGLIPPAAVAPGMGLEAGGVPGPQMPIA